MQDLRAAMPPVCMIQDDPAVLAATTSEMPAPLCEWPLPPVIVTEKGESLDEFVARSAPDFFTALQVCQLTLWGSPLLQSSLLTSAPKPEPRTPLYYQSFGIVLRPKKLFPGEFSG